MRMMILVGWVHARGTAYQKGSPELRCCMQHMRHRSITLERDDHLNLSFTQGSPGESTTPARSATNASPNATTPISLPNATIHLPLPRIPSL